MHRPAATSPPAPQTFSQNDAPGTPVDVTLLGVRVTAYAVINIAEHSRREAAGLGAVINPALLDHLLDLPVDIPVNDPVMWTEMADQPSSCEPSRTPACSPASHADGWKLPEVGFRMPPCWRRNYAASAFSPRAPGYCCRPKSQSP
jgi:hypothetical protein